MAYLIDTDWIIDHLENDSVANQLLDALAPAGIAISIITYMEAFQGVGRSTNVPHARARLQVLAARTPILPLSITVAERCADLREMLQRQGKRVRSRAFDLIIASTALEHGLTLVTRNTADYKDIPGLSLY